LGSLGGIRAGVGTTLLVQVLDREGRPVPAPADSGSVRPTLVELQALAGGEDSAGIGAIRDLRGELAYPIVARIASGTTTLGYLVVWQRVATDADGWFQELLGSGTIFYYGSRAGPWTDRRKSIPAPEVNLDSLGRVQRYRPPGEGARLAVLADVSHSPWLLGLEVSEDSVLVAPRRLLRRMALAAVLVGGLGLLAGLALSRRILALGVALTGRSGSLDSAHPTGSLLEPGSGQ
jgi:hypothetical protein